MKQKLALFIVFALFTLNSIGQCTLSFTTSAATCNNICDGSATAIVTNGTAPISYYWDNGLTTQTFDFACAGTYYCSIYDASGCSATMPVTISSPPAITFLPDSIHDVNCFGNCNGDATVYPTGGNPPYTYNWNNGQTTQKATALCATNYTVTVTDNASCNYIQNVLLSEPQQIVNTTPMFYPPYCFNASGLITVSTTGGVVGAGYNYIWNNASTSSTISSLGEGIYTVTVSDIVGCSVVNTYVLNTTDGPNPTVNWTNVMCFGAGNGKVDTIINNTPVMSAVWSNGFSSINIFPPYPQNLIPGNYTLTVTTPAGCKGFVQISVTEPSQLIETPSVFNVYCYGDSSGSIYLDPMGGTGTYTYVWGPPLSSNQGFMAYNLHAGNYPVTITDANGCTLTENNTITEPSQLIANITPKDISCFGFADGMITISMTGGTPPYYFNLDSMNINGWSTYDTIFSLTEGTYNIFIKDANYCYLPHSTYSIVEPPFFSVGNSVTQPTCTNNDGIIHLSASGGVTPYSFNWNNSMTDSVLTGLSQGPYDVTVNDAHGCTDIQYYNLFPSSSLPKLWGQVSYSGGTIPSNEAEVLLFRTNSTGAAQMDTVSTTTNSASSWNFINLMPGTYYVKANIINPSNFPNLLNGYFDNTFEWLNAIPLVLSCNDSLNIDLSLVSINPITTGNGSITGTVLMLTGAKAAGEPVPGAEIIIEQEPNDVPVQCAFTDTTGLYTFTNLVADTGYHLIVQIPGFPIFSTYSNITVFANDTLPNLNFLVDTIVGIYKDSASYVSQISINGVSLEVYPNPFISNINVKLNLTKPSDVSYELFDNLGHSILKTNNTFMLEGEHLFNISPKQIISGNCFLMIKVNETILVKKLISIKK